MTIRIIQQDKTLTHVALSGQLDLTGVAEIEKAFHDAAVAPVRPTIVDLSKVQFVMSAGINMLTQAASALKHGGAGLVLLSPQPLVEKVIHNAAMDKLAPIARSLDQARKLLGLSAS
jgi:anti-anti-sigma factor